MEFIAKISLKREVGDLISQIGQTNLADPEKARALSQTMEEMLNLWTKRYKDKRPDLSEVKKEDLQRIVSVAERECVDCYIPPHAESGMEPLAYSMPMVSSTLLEDFKKKFL